MSAPKPSKQKPTSLLNNSRFYVLSGFVLLSLILFLVLRITIVDSRLRYIRLQQFYGLFAVLCWYVVLVMSAVSKLVGQKSWMPALLYIRRPLGGAVAYFASLHLFLAVTRQLDGWSGIWLLPAVFKWSLLCAAISCVVLMIMAALSIDKIVQITKFRHWKILSRISYAAALLIIVHIWMIGTHLSSALLQLVIFQALIVLFGLEAWRLQKAFTAKKMGNGKAIVISVSIWIVLTAMLVVIRLYVPSYSTKHQDHIGEAGTAIHAH